jgi:predicted AlkP superfamily pyrophosphatase or phosphodiesterase
MKIFIFVIALYLFGFSLGFTQTQLGKPKLVVGIVIDQMRYDNLYRYWHNYSEKGFKKLVNQGFSFENTFYNYVPTYTGPGHASIYSGTTPKMHGIVANDWYDIHQKKQVYCSEDPEVQTIGSNTNAGKMSPKNLLTPNICDHLKFSTNFRSKVIGVALKDRSAIMPAGHSADAAFWFDRKEGVFISSSYYLKELPNWLVQFNNKKIPDSLMKLTWNLSLPIEKYHQSSKDENTFEGKLPEETSTSFPHKLNPHKKGKYETIVYTPYGNELTTFLAIAAIEGEKLGKNPHGVTDMLCISYSSTDYVGHVFGPNSLETEDTYIRMDKTLGDLLDYLEKNIGKDNFLLFLTADHGVAPIPDFVQQYRFSAGHFDYQTYEKNLRTFLKEKYNEDFLITYLNQNVYLDEPKIHAKGLSVAEVEKEIVLWSLNFPNVHSAINKHNLIFNEYREFPFANVQKGFYPQRSGNVILVYKPNYFDDEYGKTGTTHGACYTYDSQVPLLFYGAGIPKGKSFEEVHITDIAPTVASLIKINKPASSIGKCLKFED